MQLRATTDYAIRAILFLTEEARVCSSREIAEAMKIPRDYFIRLTKELRDAKLINAHPGRYGGYSLAQHPSKITLFDIVSAMEDMTNISGSLGKEDPCVHGEEHKCPLHLSYKLIREGFEDSLRSITVEKLLGESDSLKEACGGLLQSNEQQELA
ncbi:MAG: Rrf2 family transcriptional regulator [Raoultibacter sp.]